MVSEAPYTQKILRYIAERDRLPEIETYITPSQASKGFKKWREETSTSPSGCHLGLQQIPAYATSTKELKKNKKRHSTDTSGHHQFTGLVGVFTKSMENNS
jgi:hypothetical protein